MVDDNVRRPAFGRRKSLANAGKFHLDLDDEEEVYDFSGMSDEEIMSTFGDIVYLRTHHGIVKCFEEKADQLIDWLIVRGVPMLRFENRESTCFEDAVRQFLAASEPDWQRFPDRYWNLTYDYDYYVIRMEYSQSIISSFTRWERLLVMVGNNWLRPWRWFKHVGRGLFK